MRCANCWGAPVTDNHLKLLRDIKTHGRVDPTRYKAEVVTAAIKAGHVRSVFTRTPVMLALTYSGTRALQAKADTAQARSLDDLLHDEPHWAAPRDSGDD